jgi:hypothetical protein
MTEPLVSLFEDARNRLVAAATPQEALGRYVKPGRLVRRAPRIERFGAAWHLGVLLIAADGAVFGVADVVRAEREVPRGYAAESARARAAERAAAFRGGFAAGEVVHVGWTVLDLDAVARGEASGPLSMVDGTPSVRWSAAGAPMPLEGYLRERIALLIDPPARA